MKIGIDLDEIVFEFVKPYLRFVEEKKGISKNFEEASSYDLWEFLEIEKEEAYLLVNEFFLSERGGKLKLVDGSFEAINSLSERHKIFFITSRSETTLEKTLNQLNNFFLNFDLYFSGENDGKNKDKGELCKELGIGILIEDNGECSLKYAEEGIRVFLMDRPWNKNFEHENILRVFGWKDILEKIKEIENVN
jgi:uncharacterized HAD superfamily protein